MAFNYNGLQATVDRLVSGKTFGQTAVLTVKGVSSYDTNTRTSTETSVNRSINGVLDNQTKNYQDGKVITDIRKRFIASANGLTFNLNNAPTVDKGSGLVGIPSTSHALSVGDSTTIAGTTNYNGEFAIVSVTANEFVITASFVAETFSGTETASWSPKMNDELTVNSEVFKITQVLVEKPASIAVKYELVLEN